MDVLKGPAMNTTMKTWMSVAVAGMMICQQAAGSLKGEIDSIVGRSSQRNVSLSVEVIKADTGEVVYQHNAGVALLPASNMKLVTTAAALDTLGSDFQYVTKVGLTGNTLVIIGGGDPLLGDRETDEKHGKAACWVLDEIVKAVKASGKTEINGIIADTSVFDDVRVCPNWPVNQLNKWYEAEVSGLNFYTNCIEFIARDKGGAKAELSMQPLTSYVTVVNETTTTNKGSDTVGLWRQPGSSEISVKGKCRGETEPMKVTIERPAAYMGSLVAERLGHAGIKVEGPLLEKSAGAPDTIIATFSTPIADVLQRCNKDSLGMAAECLMKTMGAKSNGGKGGSWATGRVAMAKFLAGLGVGESEFKIDDGSGLSEENRLSANAITKVLLHVYKTKDWPMFKDSLAVGGEDGTAAKWFKEPKYKGKIIVKTGYITGVKSLSGVCVTDNGDYLFSIITNKANGSTRDAINDICKAIVDSAN
jgi:D-alanyl-D-alanine carboxypeptidase/D-alanyl-D-alanine-endopeptidase (penicillin-binding protein 4)